MELRKAGAKASYSQILLGPAAGRALRNLRGLAVVVATAALALTLSANVAQAEAPEVIVLGSSSVNGALGRLIEAKLEERGYNAKRQGKSSTGFSRPDFYDWPKEVKSMPHVKGAKAIVVYMGVNDGQSIWLHKDERPSRGGKDEWVYFRDTEEWEEKYAERVKTFVQQLCDMGPKRVVVVTPMDVVNKKLQGRLSRIRSIQKRATESTSCGLAVAAEGDDADIRAGGARRSAIRIKDGSHATQDGAMRVWKRIESKLVGALPPPASPPPGK